MDLATSHGRECPRRRASLQNDCRRSFEPHGTSPRPTHRLLAPQRSQSPSHLRPKRGRVALSTGPWPVLRCHSATRPPSMRQSNGGVDFQQEKALACRDTHVLAFMLRISQSRVGKSSCILRRSSEVVEDRSNRHHSFRGGFRSIPERRPLQISWCR